MNPKHTQTAGYCRSHSEWSASTSASCCHNAASPFRGAGTSRFRQEITSDNRSFDRLLTLNTAGTKAEGPSVSFMVDKPELYDPFQKVRGFKYTGSLRAVYPLSPKTKIPAHIRRPNYGREAVSMVTAHLKLFPSRRIRVNTTEDQEGVRKVAKVCTIKRTPSSLWSRERERERACACLRTCVLACGCTSANRLISLLVNHLIILPQ